jgi:hypothetical protein
MRGQPMEEHLKHPKVRLEIEMGRLDDLIADLVLVKILATSQVLGIAINQNATCKPNIEYNVKYQDDGTDKFYLSLLGSISGRDARHRCRTGLFLRSLPIPQILSSQEDLFRLFLHSRPCLGKRIGSTAT